MDELSDDEFLRKYQAYEREAARHLVKGMSSTEAELREIIGYLIQRRQETKQAEVEGLESKAKKLADQLRETERSKLLSEISCFKDILELQRQLLNDDDEDRH